MKTDVRRAAVPALHCAPAKPMTDNPAARLEAMYRRIWLSSMRDLPFVNLALSVEAVGFRRCCLSPESRMDSGPAERCFAQPDGDDGIACGDWVGAVITPWFVNLFVLPGGGNLWSDLPAGERCHIAFPIGPLEFIADDDVTAEVPAYQYCPLFAPPGQFGSQAAARAAAMAALNAMFSLPAAAHADTPAPRTKPAAPARRSFLRRIARR